MRLRSAFIPLVVAYRQGVWQRDFGRITGNPESAGVLAMFTIKVSYNDIAYKNAWPFSRKAITERKEKGKYIFYY